MEPGDTIMEKVADTQVVLPCDAQGRSAFVNWQTQLNLIG